MVVFHAPKTASLACQQAPIASLHIVSAVMAVGHSSKPTTPLRARASAPPTLRAACCKVCFDLSGAAIDSQEIEVLCEAFRAYSAESKRWIVLMLHSSLPAEDQDKV